jgi:hypothetical protein
METINKKTPLSVKSIGLGLLLNREVKNLNKCFETFKILKMNVNKNIVSKLNISFS